ncbi:MAG: serine hydrolase [Chloroflexi bacterium]|nr:MAG: serine hydrolase [Chloroflexota bacterium]
MHLGTVRLKSTLSVLETSLVVSVLAVHTLLAGPVHLVIETARVTVSAAKRAGLMAGIGLVLLLAGLPAAPAQAQMPPSPTDLSALEQFLDETIIAQLDELEVPGAAVAVVAGGQLLLVKGYGVADREQNRLVDGERTLFRTGSVGKLITWTAVMQLVERGQLDLHTDVNEYLDFTIPATFPEPITLAHLMTHTAGFEDVGEALFVLSEAEMMPLHQYLIELQPARVFAPGTVQAYSNYGTALAGYIVERVSGEPFVDYVENQIFAPLEMRRSTLRQPVPAELSGDLAAGYGGGEYRHMKGRFVYAVPYPAGGMSASAADMARFMLAHLQEGRYEEVTILQPATVQAMHRRQYAADPRLDGMGYGFMRQRVNGHDVLFHRGSTFQFNAGLYLLPSENVGLYVVYNGLRGIVAPAQLWEAFMDRYYPGPAPAPLTPDAGQRLAVHTGEYHLARADFSGPGKIFRLLEGAQVSEGQEGHLQLMVEGYTERYVQVEPGLFRHQEREEYLAFHTGADGTQWLSLDGRPAFLNFTATSAFQVPWYASLTFAALLILLMLLFIGSSLVWFIGVLRHRGQERPLPVRLSRWLTVAFGLSFLLFLLGLVSVVGDIDPLYGVPRIVFGTPPIVDVILLLPWLLTSVALALAIGTGWVWWKSIGTERPAAAPWSRLHLTLLTALSLVVVWWLAYWNLLA